MGLTPFFLCLLTYRRVSFDKFVLKVAHENTPVFKSRVAITNVVEMLVVSEVA